MSRKLSVPPFSSTIFLCEGFPLSVQLADITETECEDLVTRWSKKFRAAWKSSKQPLTLTKPACCHCENGRVWIDDDNFETCGACLGGAL